MCISWTYPVVQILDEALLWILRSRRTLSVYRGTAAAVAAADKLKKLVK